MKQYQKLQVDCTPSVPARKTRRMASILEPLVLILVPATLAVCAVCDYQQAALLTFVVAVAAIAVFFLSFERSKPALRQIMPTVVLAALAAAGRSSSRPSLISSRSAPPASSQARRSAGKAASW